MKAGIEIGTSHDFKLETALLLYRDQGKTFVTHHQVVHGPTLSLGPAKMLSISFLKNLLRSFRMNTTLEVLPENVIAHGDDTVAWWTPAQPRQMFFDDPTEKMTAVSGRIFPHPALVFVAKDSSIWVRALAESKRPGASTILYAAPYWNMAEDGAVCLGNMRTPDTNGVNAIAPWERGFFESAFSHAGGTVRITSYKSGFEGLWKALADATGPFPIEHLVSTKETLASYLSKR